jgi:UDP-N-acetylglucosamine 2-epimerase (non-hydrolysing)
MRIPVYHLEAGNRSFDLNVPEEINRKIVDHSSDFNLCYTSHAARNLEREGIHPRFVSVIGSPLREVIDSVKAKVHTSKILTTLELQKDEYFLVSIHRQENIDVLERLHAIISCINRMTSEYSLKTIVSAHPRFRDKLSKQNKVLNENVHLTTPLGYVDFLKLQSESRIVISDSGSISEEAAILGIRAITIRDSMERPEALESGSILLAGTEPDHFMKTLRVALSEPISKVIPIDYQTPDSSTRVVNFIMSTVSQYHFWSGIRHN